MTKPASSGRYRLFAWLLLRNSLIFALVYGGGDYVTSLHNFRIPVHFAIEEKMPFVPGMVLFYLSIFPLFILVPFVLRRACEIRRLALVMAKVIAFAGLCFLLFPVEDGFQTPDGAALGHWAALYHFADQVNLTYNDVPSLHVALSVACIDSFTYQAHGTGKFILWTWALLITISTLLIHQHYLLDVVTGWILAFVMTRNARHAQPDYA